MSAEPDFLAQLIEATARKTGHTADTVQFVIETAMLSVSLTEPCPTCRGSGKVHRRGGDALMGVDPCPACEGSGRVSSGARLMLSEQVEPRIAGELDEQRCMRPDITANTDLTLLCYFADDPRLSLPVYRVITKGADT